VHALFKKASRWHIIGRSLIVHKWIMQPLIKNFSVSLQHYANYIQCSHRPQKHPQHWWLFTATSLLDLSCWWIRTGIALYVDGPCNVIADTFSRLLHSDMSSPLVEKKASYVDSNSESGNRNESSHSLIMDDRDITDCLMNLPCSPSRKIGRETKHAESVPKQDRMNKTNPSCRLTLMIPL